MDRLTSSPEQSPEANMSRTNDPTTPTPDPAIRNRFHTSPLHEETAAQEPASPTSTTASTGSLPRSSLRGVLSSASVAAMSLPSPPRRLVIRADPAMVTCFDPADKELYDLWAPKR